MSPPVEAVASRSMATVKNEFLAASPTPPLSSFHWPVTIFHQPPQQHSIGSMKDDYNPWSLEQPTPESSCNSFSPLNENEDALFAAAGMFLQPDPEPLSCSMSSLDSLDSHNGFSTASNMGQEEDEEQEERGLFTTSFSNQQQQQRNYENNVLLNSVVKSRIDELASELEVDMEELIAATPVAPPPAAAAVALPEPPRQQVMPPPPPVPPRHGFVVPIPPDSLGTIRSFDFQQPLQAPFFAGWGSSQQHQQQQHQVANLAWSSPGAAVTAPMNAAPWVQQHHSSNQIQQIHHQQQQQDPQVLLVQLLVMCAQAVADNDERMANVILVRLKEKTSHSGTPMERLASYFAEALEARITRTTGSALFKGLVSDKLLASDGTSLLDAFSSFYDFLPIGKFDHLTMNQVILDAVERERSIHILDLHLWFGTQWPAFLQALATRPGGPPRVRITAMGTSARDLNETGRKLLDCARHLRVHLEYVPLIMTNLLDDFHAGLVSVRRDEMFIVNSLSQFHYLLNGDSDTSCSASPCSGITTTNSSNGISNTTSNGNGKNNRFARFLRELRALGPKVLVMAENDASHNSPAFLNRFGECLKYYSAVFDAMATCASSPSGRLKMERLFAAPKIRNIVACEGAERVERHESMADWSRRLEAAGFRTLPLSQRAVNQARLLLRLYYTNGYTLHSERGYLVLGWRNLPLNTISAWRAI